MTNNPNPRLWLSPPHMNGSELEYVRDCFSSNWIAPLGPHVNEFERELAAYVGVQHAAVLSSGTAAIHLGLRLLGVQPGDLVLCSTLTFVASANPIVYLGATPVFVDSEIDSWNMSPKHLEIAIAQCKKQGKRPAAAVIVDLYGTPANLSSLDAILRKEGIPWIEDAAEALGSSYSNKKLGSFGNCGVLSFNGNKIITTSGGGALVSDDARIIEQARFLATQARDSAAHYEHSTLGFNYRMSNVLAAIGRGQLKSLEEWVLRRRRNFDFYRSRLAKLPGISFPSEPPECFSNRWLTTILIDSEKACGVTPEIIRLELEKKNIESRPVWKPLHSQPLFRDAPFFGDGTADHLFASGLCLPSGSAMSDADLERVCLLIESRFH